MLGLRLNLMCVVRTAYDASCKWTRTRSLYRAWHQKAPTSLIQSSQRPSLTCVVVGYCIVSVRSRMARMRAIDESHVLATVDSHLTECSFAAGSISAACRTKGRAAATAAEDDPDRYADPIDFVKYIDSLQELGFTYSSQPGERDTGTNRRVLQYLRAESYNDRKFQQIIGAADAGFVDYVDANLGRKWDGYIDPEHCIAVHADHWGVSTEGFLKYPAKGVGEVNWADFLGWGGDLVSFYAKWQGDGDGDAAWCSDELFTPGETFDLRDMIEDADAYNMGTAMHTGSATVAELTRENLIEGARAAGFVLCRLATSKPQPYTSPMKAHVLAWLCIF